MFGSVIPAKAGIHLRYIPWIPASDGVWIVVPPTMFVFDA